MLAIPAHPSFSRPFPRFSALQASFARLVPVHSTAGCPRSRYAAAAAPVRAPTPPLPACTAAVPSPHAPPPAAGAGTPQSARIARPLCRWLPAQLPPSPRTRSTVGCPRRHPLVHARAVRPLRHRQPARTLRRRMPTRPAPLPAACTAAIPSPRARSTAGCWRGCPQSACGVRLLRRQLPVGRRPSPRVRPPSHSPIHCILAGLLDYSIQIGGFLFLKRGAIS